MEFGYNTVIPQTLEVQMIDFLNTTVTYWHWIILGIVLIILEMSIGTFFILWLGLASIIVGLISMSIDIGFVVELSLWTLLSIVVTAVWFRWFRGATVSNSGQSNYRLDTLGTVTEDIAPHNRGRVKFDKPVLGNTIWHATSKLDIKAGSRVQIVEINGLLMDVEPQIDKKEK